MRSIGPASAIALGLSLSAFIIGVVAGEVFGVRDLAVTSVSLGLGLLLTALGNLSPKTVPVGQQATMQTERNAGRVLVLGGVSVMVFALIGPPRLALTFGSIIGLISIVLAAGSLFLNYRSKTEGRTMSKSTAARLAGLNLLVGLAAAFALILIDRSFGDQVAQWSAVVMVLIMGLVGSMALTVVRKAQSD